MKDAKSWTRDAAMATTVLKPVAGFCVKSSSLQSGFYTQFSSRQPSSSASNVLEPHGPIRIPIPKNLKIFLNVAWDPHVPPPPDGSEDMIQVAMLGGGVSELNRDGWYVPVIVSDPREAKDRGQLGRFLCERSKFMMIILAGKPSLVFDAIYNSTLKSRALKDPAFKTFLIGMSP